MAKKFLLGLLMAAIIGSAAFAQENAENWGGKKNFLSADVGLLVAGLRYERLLMPKLSVGADSYWANSLLIFNELEAGVFARYYLYKGLYGELGLGYHIHTGFGSLSLGGGVGITPALGWKFDPGKAGGFFVAPQVSVPITIGEVKGSVGVGVGFLVGCSLGWAF